MATGGGASSISGKGEYDDKVRRDIIKKNIIIINISYWNWNIIPGNRSNKQNINFFHRSVLMEIESQQQCGTLFNLLDNLL